MIGTATEPTLRRRRMAMPSPLVMQQIVLVVLLIAELAVFSSIGTNFVSSGNARQTLRLSVEIGLLAVALTPVIVTGGIDLSVGSLMGLSAVLLGKLWRDGHLPIGVAAIVVVAIGLAAGAINGLLVTRLKIAPLIVTLGTFSLYRGLAEGITGGSDNFTGFPEAFNHFGQGYFWQIIPMQLPIFVAVIVFFWILLHRSTIGRSLFAIGFSEEGARHAGIPVDRRVLLAYVLCGGAAALAAVIDVAHLGQAKADVGTGYELDAITAVVLGGTSIFGGRGSMLGTLLGLIVITVLRTGLPLAEIGDEMVGILSGVLLIGSLVVNRALLVWSARRSSLS
jgi:rhamnose transport system permease protein